VIVISGVLLLVAVVFLIVGLFGPLGWVYASIGVSVLSFIFLLLGVRQRRAEVPATSAAGTGAALPTAPTPTAPVAAAASAGDDDVTVVGRSSAPRAAAPSTAAAATTAAAAQP
jgi:hypothetical protein